MSHQGETMAVCAGRCASVLTVLLCTCAPVAAQFGSPLRVSDGSGSSTSHTTAVDLFGVVHVAHAQQETLFITSRSPEFTQQLEVAAKGRDPQLSVISVGLRVAFIHDTEDEGGERSLLCLSSRLGNGVSSPTIVAESRDGRLSHPAMRLAADGEPAFAWQCTRADGTREVFVRARGLGGRAEPATFSLGRGEAPSLEIDGTDRIVVFFLRDGEIHHTVSTSGADGEPFEPPRSIRPAGVRGPPHSAPRTGRAAGVIHLCYASGGALYLGQYDGGELTAPRRLVATSVSRPALHVDANGTIAIAYERNGDIFHMGGSSGSLSRPEPVTATPESETSPSVVTDGFGNSFISFERQGEIFLATNAPAPRARFHVEPAAGEAPLQVRFIDDSEGDITNWLWDFGDGSTSRQRSATHVFQTRGEYRVRLRVGGPGGESTHTLETPIVVSRPGNGLRLADVAAFPGQQSVQVPVVLDHEVPAQGFQIAAVFDPTALEVVGVDVAASNAGFLTPELFEFNVSNDPADPFVVVGVLFDIRPPVEGRVLRPGTDHRIANLLVNVPARTPPESELRIELRHRVGAPPVNNIVISGGQSLNLALDNSGSINVVGLRQPPERFFLRGDFDDSDDLTLSDAVATLLYLFLAGPRPSCMDAADATDDGRVDLADALRTLNFLFRAGSYPPPPFPVSGFDPTEDDLPPCLLRRG